MIYDFFQKRVLTDFFSAQMPSIKKRVLTDFFSAQVPSIKKQFLTDFFSAQVPSIKKRVQRYCFFLIYANFLETFFTFIVSL